MHLAIQKLQSHLQNRAASGNTTPAALAVDPDMDTTESNKRSADAALAAGDNGIESDNGQSPHSPGKVGKLEIPAVAPPATDDVALDGNDLEEVEEFEGNGIKDGVAASKSSQHFSKLAAQLHTKLEETGSHADSASAKSSRSAPYVDCKKGKGKATRKDGGPAWDDLLGDDQKQL